MLRLDSLPPKGMKLLLAVLILSGCGDDDPSWKMALSPHIATSWRVTPGGITRDAGPFKSVERGYTTEEEIDADLDAARLDFQARFPEFAWVNPLVHLTDDYVFWTPRGWAAGWRVAEYQIALPIWSRTPCATDPGDVFLKRPPDGDNNYWRYTGRPLVPAYQHECLHVAIGYPDVDHRSPLWLRL